MSGSHIKRLDRTPTIQKFNDEDLRSVSGRYGIAFHVQFIDDDLKANFYEPGNPIHKSYMLTSDSWDEGTNPTTNNKAWVAIEDSGEDFPEPFAVGMPFHAKHFHDLTVDWHDTPVCQTSYLALATSEHTHPRPDGDHPSAFVMQAEEPAIVSGCDHSVDLDSGRRQSGWKALALLAGWRQVRSNYAD